MKTIPILLASLSLVMPAVSASAQSSVFNYQGHLIDGGSSANGSYDLQFTLKNALTGGSTVGTPQVVAPVSVVNGIFTVALDFGGAVFDGSDRWVEMGVRPFGSAVPYTVLAPRQNLTSAPYAVKAQNAGSAANLTGTITGANIPAGTITGAMLANNTITSTQIENGAVGSAQLANNAVGAAQIASGAVTLSKIAATSASGYLGQGVLSGLTTGTTTATVTFTQPFSSTPPVVIQQPGWTLGAVSATGFSATTPFAPVTVDSAGNVGAYTSLAVVSGRPAISYFDDTNDDLKYAIAPDADGSGTWTTVTVDSAGSVGQYTSLAVVNGRPAISYFDATNFDLKYAIAPSADGTGVWTTLTVDSAGAVGQYTSLAVVNGRPAISYYDASNDNLKYAIAPSADGIGVWTTVTVDSAAGNVGQDTSLAVVSGRPAISYQDFSSADLKYAIAPSPDGTGTWTTVTVDSAGIVGSYTSLAVVNGRPAISYLDFTNADLKYAIASISSSADGTGTWTTVTVDSAGTTGGYTSLAVVNGRPAISYRDGSVTNLKYAIAPSPDGTGTWTTVTVDSAGSVGEFTSLAVVNGRPAISYRYATNGDLKYAQLPDGLWTAGDASELGAGLVDNTEFTFLDGLTSGIQGQINGKVSKAGDTMTGPLILPANGMIVGTNQLIASGGNVGIGTASPTAILDVNGTAKATAFVGDGSGLTNLDLSGKVSKAGDTMSGPLTLQTITGDASATARLSLIANGAHEWRLQSVTGFGQPIPGSGPTASFQLINTTSAVTALTALQDGKVGLGRIPTANRLEVEGDASKTTASGWAANSDRRIKEDIQPVMNALDTLGKVRLVDFRYTDDYRAAHPGIADQRYLNVVAQEFAEVFPNHVKSSGEKLPDGSEILQVDTYPLTIYSAAAVQELHAKLKAKEDEIAGMKARLERLEKLLEKGTSAP